MFDLERFMADCRAARSEHSPQAAVKEIVARAGAIHVYGGDFFAAPRSEFDPDTFEERPYDAERAKRLFREANDRLHAQQGKGWASRADKYVTPG